ncbi:MAG: aminopeptidase [Caldilineaceae bacterium]|nr:aminopeptidase [Caldilineaceae bacterium]
MSTEFDQKLQTYADLIVKVGLNVQPGQRLLIARASIPSAPLIREIAKAAYKAGARFVDVMWGDEQLQLIRLQHAPRDSFAEYPTWHVHGKLEYLERSDALLGSFIIPSLMKMPPAILRWGRHISSACWAAKA